MSRPTTDALIVPASAEGLRRAVQVVKQGGIVAFPTETYYGLGVDPMNQQALARLFSVKQRPSHKPILNLVERRSQIDLLAAEIPDLFEPLIEQLWPGPLTLIFNAAPCASVLLTGGSGTVGIRISSHSLAREFVRQVGGPLTATSANLSGALAAKNSREVAEQLGSGVDLILDGGETPGGMGSTIVALRDSRLVLIRDGAMPFSQIEKKIDCQSGFR